MLHILNHFFSYQILIKRNLFLFPLSLEGKYRAFSTSSFHQDCGFQIVVGQLLHHLSYGWTSLACELMQIFAIFCNLGKRFIPRIKDDSCNGTSSFPYHKEVPRLLFFGFLGFTCSILAPLVVSFVSIYFLLAYFVYRNQVYQ